VSSGPAKLDFTTQPWATISGVVASALDGAPVPGLHVLAGNEAFDARAMQDLMTGKGPVSDAAGRFTVSHVPTGAGELVVMAKAGFEPLATRDYQIAAGQRLDLGTITVVPPRGGTIGIVASPENGSGGRAT